MKKSRAFLLLCALAAIAFSREGLAQSSLGYSTFLGGAEADGALDVAVDSLGFLYVVGTTQSTDFFGSTDTPGGDRDAFLLKFKPGDSQPEFARVFGGNRDEFGHAVCVQGGMVYVAGVTNSENFPLLNSNQLVIGGYDNTGTGDAYLAGFDLSGNLVFSTYFGGDGGDVAYDVACHERGPFITGNTNSRDLPATGVQEEMMGVSSVFVASFAPRGGFAVATYLGGNGEDIGTGIDVRDDGVVIVGTSFSDDYPTVAAQQASRAGNGDVIVTRFSYDLGSVVFSTFLGGTDPEEGSAIRFDDDGNIFLVGLTGSPEFPVTAAAFQPTIADEFSDDNFIMKLSSTGQLLFSSFLGGTDRESQGRLDVSGGHVYFVSETQSDDFPLVNPLDGFDTLPGPSAAVIVEIDPGLPQPEVVFSTFLGGSQSFKGNTGAGVVYHEGAIYAVGSTSAEDFPTTAGAMVTSFHGDATTFKRDGWVARIDQGLLVNSTGDDPDLDTMDGLCDTGNTIATGDAECTLRAAIQEANEDPDESRIRFDIPGAGPHVIKPAPALPTVSTTTVIDGTTEPDWSGMPVVVVDGSDLGFAPSAHGLHLTADGSEVRGLVIQNFAKKGIRIVDADDNVIAQNLIGLSADGSAAAGNGEDGLFLSGSSGNTIEGNTISANGLGSTGGINVLILGPGAANNVFRDNEVGTSKGGLTALSNAGGLRLDGASTTTVGGAIAADANYFGGNSVGIEITGANAADNVVSGNRFGIARDGTTALPNNIGILIREGSGTVIGGADANRGAAPGNLIYSASDGGHSSLPGHGIQVLADATDVGILGNSIGLNEAGTTQLFLGGIDGIGILIDGADGTDVSGNVVSDADSIGVAIVGADDVTLHENWLGTTASGMGSAGNPGHGLVLTDATGATISDNVIVRSGSRIVITVERHGILIQGSGGTNHVLTGNRVGQMLDGTPQGNGGHGIMLENVSDNVVAGILFPMNRITDNRLSGIAVVGGTGNVLAPNIIKDNRVLGIDLRADGVPLVNDAGDSDGASNQGQNHPVFRSAVRRVGTFNTYDVRGVLQSVAGTPFDVVIYRNSACGPGGFGQGEAIEATETVTTDANGTAALELVFSPGLLNPDRVISAVATDPDGNTSEFGPCFRVDGDNVLQVIVNSQGDSPDVNTTDGMCSTGGTNSEGNTECTLRAAMEEANASADPYSILFDIPGDVPMAISPAVPLPSMGSFINLDGTSQPGYDGQPVIHIDGASVTGPGIVIDGDNSVVAGVAIGSFSGEGLRLEGDNGRLVASDIGNFADVAAGNGASGVLVSGDSVRIGSASPLEANRITENGEDGVRIDGAVGARVTGNSIWGNAGLGINLVGGTEDAAGVTANDSGDADTGSNGLQNFPVLGSASADDGTATGTLDGVPDMAYTIEVFSSDTCDASGFGEGQNFIARVDVTADAQGAAAFSVDGVQAGMLLSATATDSGGNTSEFSRCEVAQSVASEANLDLPRTVTLEPNYPNPFNPSTTIRFSVPAAGPVALDVFDLMGRLVARVASVSLPAGTHAFEWDGRRADGGPAASGMYVYMLRTADRQVVRTMVLLK